MLSIQVVTALVVGFVLGVLFVVALFKAKNSSGDFLITKDEEGLYSYTLKLEEEPEGLHGSRYILFKVKKQ